MQENIKDFVIVGGGPSALTAALYATRENINTVVYEKGAVGGLVATVDMIDNYPGFPDGIEGMALAEQLEKQARRFGADIAYGEVSAIKPFERNFAVTVDGSEIIAKSVLVASGSSYRMANVPGEKEYFGRGVHYCATCDGAFYTNRRIVVVGGGNAAVQEAMYLTKFASSIHLLVRNKISASEVLVEDLDRYVKAGKITVHLKSPITEIIGDGKHVTSVKFTNDEKDVTLETDGVFVFIGLIPNTSFLKGSGVRLDKSGFIKTNLKMETRVPGIFASGDVRSGSTRQIASAAGEGVTAANSVSEYLEHL